MFDVHVYEILFMSRMALTTVPWETRRRSDDMSYNNSYAFDGNAALALDRPSRPNLVVVESDNRRRVCRMPREARRSQDTRSSATVVIGLCAAALLMAILFVGVDNARASVASASLSEATLTTVYVHPGDTLWGIASDHLVEGASVSDVEGWIVEANGLDSSDLQPGQSLVVPVVG